MKTYKIGIFIKTSAIFENGGHFSKFVNSIKKKKVTEASPFKVCLRINQPNSAYNIPYIQGARKKNLITLYTLGILRTKRNNNFQ